LAWRRHQLLQLARFAQENADGLAECLSLDLGRPKQEAFMAEVGAVVGRCLICADKLEEWTLPEELVVPDWQASWKPRVEKHPKGVVLIIACVISSAILQCLNK
jgi:aldehyde dehydrogenase (NAD+)